MSFPVLRNMLLGDH